MRDNKAESTSAVSVSENMTHELMDVGVGISLVKEMRRRSRGGVDSLLSQISGGEAFGNCVDVSVFPLWKRIKSFVERVGDK